MLVRLVMKKGMVSGIRRMTAALSLVGLMSGCSMFSAVDERPADITLEELEIKKQQAMDPQDRFKEAQSFVQREVLTISKWFFSAQCTVETKFKKPDRFRLTTYMEGRPLVTIIYNAGKAWQVNYQENKVEAISGSDLEQLRVVFDLNRPDSTYQSTFQSVDLTECEIDDHEYYHLHCVSGVEGMPPIDFYISKKSFMTKRLVIEGVSDSLIERYALEDDVIIPQEILGEQDGVTTRSKVVYYKLNAIINDNEFLPPTLKSGR